MPGKVWLRNKASKRYFTHSGEWILNRSDAFDFNDVEVALTYGRRSGIAGLEVVLENDARELTVQVLSSRDATVDSHIFGSRKAF
jgi:hypothetical protein